MGRKGGAHLSDGNISHGECRGGWRGWEGGFPKAMLDHICEYPGVDFRPKGVAIRGSASPSEETPRPDQ